jgi:hypothetical protein
MKPLFKRLLIAVGTLLILFIAAEIILRKVWGFCDAPLYRADNHFEYILKPNQLCYRFGKKSYYNSYSQRNDEITPQDSIIIDGFGDSVINGGVLSDQDSIATTKLSKYLTAKYGKKVLVLNIAAGSWGPDNCYAYLQQYGNFHCKSMFLVVSSHDSFDDMTFEPTVGKDPEHPDKQYTFATWELIDRYVIPRIFKKKGDTTNLFINKQTGDIPFNSGFRDFFRYSAANHIPLFFYLHAERGEVKMGRYNNQGQMIIDTCNYYHIPLIKEMDYHLTLADYRDNIHLNDKGQEKMFEILRNQF